MIVVALEPWLLEQGINSS